MKYVFLLFAALTLSAQETITTTTTTAPDTVATATTATTTTAPVPDADAATDDDTPPASRVTSVAGIPVRKNGMVRLGDEVRIDVQGIEELRRRATEHGKPITLWINGLDSRLEPTGIEQRDGDSGALTYRLTRTGDNSSLWRNILRNPFEKPGAVRFSAGVAEDRALLYKPGVVHPKVQKVFFAPEGVVSAILFLIVAIILWRHKSDMLRGGPDIDGKKQAYSLGRSQMAWWFLVILASYITIWLITGDRDTITASSLVLIGISAATAAGSIAIDANAPARANETRRELEAEKISLASSPTAVAAQSEAATPQQQDAADAINMRVAEIDQKVATVMKPPITSGSWLRDVLTDNQGMVALHRFQIIVWTAVLGVIFVTSVLRDLSMPEFNATLLTLMGISAGTYLGFKLPNNGG